MKARTYEVLEQRFQSNLLGVNRTMAVHVNKDFDLEVPTHTGTLCGMAPEYATVGYNVEWELVHRLDTGKDGASTRCLSGMSKNDTAIQRATQTAPTAMS